VAIRRAAVCGSEVPAADEIFGEEDSALRTGVVSFFPYSFEASMKISNTFMHKEKRFSYSTPKSFLELLKLYTGMLGGKVDALEDKKRAPDERAGEARSDEGAGRGAGRGANREG
jgi:hypothetical protein